MLIIKKDFVNENTISCCGKGKKLSSGTAYYMKSTDGMIHYGGKKCAESLASNNINSVPDLTKSLISMTTSSKPVSSGGSGERQEENRRAIAIAYLLLREELLKDFKCKERSLSHETLSSYYDDYKRGELGDDAVDHIISIENYVSTKIEYKLSLRNLSTCHAYNFILNRVLAHLTLKSNEKGISYVSSLKTYLETNCTLTDSQVEGLKRWVEYLPRELRDAKLLKF